MDDANNPKLYPAWRQVEADLLARGLKDGETIAMDYLRQGFGVEDPSTLAGEEVLRQQALFNFSLGALAASLLENHRIMLRLLPNVGYMVLPPSEQTPLVMKDMASDVAALLAKSARGVSFVRTDQLDDAQRKENADAIAKLGALRAVVAKRLKGPAG